MSLRSSLSKGKGKEVKISLNINRSRSSSTTSVADNMSSDIDHIPEDVWLTVFEHLKPQDLARLSSTCHRLHSMTQRPLLREITWSKATSASQNIHDWGPEGSLNEFTGIVRKVTIRLSFKRTNNGALVMPVDWEFYDSVYHRLLSFSNLRSLELIDTVLTPALYPILADIPSLREVSIIRCNFIWTPLYPTILSNLGRPVPPGGVPDGYTVSHSTPAEIALQRQWYLENHSFDWAQRLNHITRLTFQYNRTGRGTSMDRPPCRSDDLPFPTSEIGKPSILHPLYLLTIPSLEELTLSWNATLMNVSDTLRSHIFIPPVPVPAVAALTPPAGPAPTQAPTLGAVFPFGPPTHPLIIPTSNALRASNPFGLSVFSNLRPTFPRLRHVTLLVDDLSRDMMDGLANLFEPRINSPAAGLAPLRTKLRVGKQSLSEQHMGNLQFRLQGVYDYEGPLQVAGMLMSNVNQHAPFNMNFNAPPVPAAASQPPATMEEVRMSEPMEMNLILHTLEKLPRSLKKLHVMTFRWDQEILYAVRALFKGLTELVVKYGRGGLRENTHVILGSDILPELTQLHTLRILQTGDCIKSEQRYPFPPHIHGGGGMGGFPGGGMGYGGAGSSYPSNPTSNTAWWAIPACGNVGVTGRRSETRSHSTNRTSHASQHSGGHGRREHCPKSSRRDAARELENLVSPTDSDVNSDEGDGMTTPMAIDTSRSSSSSDAVASSSRSRAGRRMATGENSADGIAMSLAMAMVEDDIQDMASDVELSEVDIMHMQQRAFNQIQAMERTSRGNQNGENRDQGQSPLSHDATWDMGFGDVFDTFSDTNVRSRILNLAEEVGYDRLMELANGNSLPVGLSPEVTGITSEMVSAVLSEELARRGSSGHDHLEGGEPVTSGSSSRATSGLASTGSSSPARRTGGRRSALTFGGGYVPEAGQDDDTPLGAPSAGVPALGGGTSTSGGHLFPTSLPVIHRRGSWSAMRNRPTSSHLRRSTFRNRSPGGESTHAAPSPPAQAKNTQQANTTPLPAFSSLFGGDDTSSLQPMLPMDFGSPSLSDFGFTSSPPSPFYPFPTTSTGSSSSSFSSTPTHSNSSPAPTPTERLRTEASEARRIAQSLQDDLADYLVGWNRHCPNLRVVQIESGVVWRRRFVGDGWAPGTL